MTTKYPNEIDGIQQLPIIIDLQSEVVAAVPNAQRSAILAIEQELGVKPSGTFGSVKDRLNSVDVDIADVNTELVNINNEITDINTEINIIDTQITDIINGEVNVGGDLSGTVAAATVFRLRGLEISNSTPTDGYVLTYDSSLNQWIPYPLTLGGDLSGIASDATVIKIQNVDISAVSPSDGEFLTYNNLGSMWEPGSVPNATLSEFGTIKLDGDISGTASSITVTKIQNIDILDETPADGYVLTYSTSNSRWEPQPITTSAVDPFAGLGCTSELRVDEGVEHGTSVSRWRDQRSYKDFIAFQRDANLFQGTVLPGEYTSDLGDGFPAIQFNSTPTVRRMFGPSPIITSGIFSIAIRIYVPASNNITILTCTQCFPGFDNTATILEISTGTQSGGNIPIRFNLTDDAATNVEADMDVTKDAWHTLIFRTDATRMLIRSDGVNGVTSDTTAFTTFNEFDTSGLACLIDATDGSQNGFGTNMNVRHILIADGATWTDGECVTVETEFTNLWT